MTLDRALKHSALESPRGESDSTPDLPTELDSLVGSEPRHLRSVPGKCDARPRLKNTTKHLWTSVSHVVKVVACPGDVRKILALILTGSVTLALVCLSVLYV